MGYKLRFVQYFDKKDSQRFLEIEKKFIELEQKDKNMVSGSRYVPLMGREPSNTLVWEAEFSSLEGATECLKNIEQNSAHDSLLDAQIIYMRDAYVEIYKKLD